MHRVDADGKLTGRLDFLKYAHQAVIRRVRETSGKVIDGEHSGHAVTVTVAGITKEGLLSADLEAYASPKESGSNVFAFSFEAKITQPENGEMTAQLVEAKSAE